MSFSFWQVTFPARHTWSTDPNTITIVDEDDDKLRQPNPGPGTSRPVQQLKNVVQEVEDERDNDNFTGRAYDCNMFDIYHQRLFYTKYMYTGI